MTLFCFIYELQFVSKSSREQSVAPVSLSVSQSVCQYFTCMEVRMEVRAAS